MGKRSSGFTLVEVLLVLALLGLSFSIISTIFVGFMNSLIRMQESSETLRERALLLMDIKRKVLSAKEVALKGNQFFMHSAGGSYFPGLVKCGYVYKAGQLYYYEFPYPYGDILYYEEDKLVKLAKLSKFKVLVDGMEEFKGKPSKVEVFVDNEKLILTLR